MFFRLIGHNLGQLWNRVYPRLLRGKTLVEPQICCYKHRQQACVIVTSVVSESCDFVKRSICVQDQASYRSFVPSSQFTKADPVAELCGAVNGIAAGQLEHDEVAKKWDGCVGREVMLWASI